jgi:fructoselysine-6-P-deglycase FrlB-like protein
LNPRLRICITTLGDRGSRISYGSESHVGSFELEALDVGSVVDRAGAGDAFHAGLLYGLGNDLDEMDSEPVLKPALDLAQGLAGLTCMEYGSRGYFLRKLVESDFKKSVLADVEALRSGELEWKTTDPKVLFNRYRDRLLSQNVCGVCGYPLLEGGDTLYDRKIDSAPGIMAATYDLARKKRETLPCGTGQRIYIVGSGASLSVAQFGAIFLNQLTDVHAIPVTPYEYISLCKERSPTILISFGGNNPDILAALARAKDILSPEIHVITGDAKSQLARHAKQIEGTTIHEIPSKAFDAGFVSTQGLLACSSMLLTIISRSVGYPEDKLTEFFNYEHLYALFGAAKKDVTAGFAYLEDRFDSIEDLHLVALGSGWAWPAVVDFESKITEGAVCTIEISELKNYTHGRYLNAYRHKESRFFVLFALPADSRLIRFLKEKLGRDFPVMLLATEHEPPFGTLDLMIRGLYASSVISKRHGLDIAKATRFPKESRGLYSWGPIYTPTSRIEEFLDDKTQRKNPAGFQAKLA